MALTDNLISYYKLDGNSNDAHGSNNGTINGATYTASGKINGAYDFDGTNDYIGLTTLGTLGNSLDAGLMTFACWIKTTQTTIGFIMGTFNDSLTTGISIEINNNSAASNASGRIRVYVRDNDNNFYTGGVNTDTGINNGDWHFLVVTIDPSGKSINVYVDNSLQTFTEGSIIGVPDNFSNFQYPLYLGAFNNRGTASGFYDGIIDEVGIWSRALSSTELGQLYNGGAGLTYPFTSDISNPFLSFNF